MLVLLLALCCLISVALGAVLPGRDVTVKSHLGPVHIRLIGDKFDASLGRDPVICVHGMSKSLVNEWTINVAPTLAEAKYTVLSLDLFSNSKTYPHSVTEEGFAKLMIDDIMRNYLNVKKGKISILF